MSYVYLKPKHHPDLHLTMVWMGEEKWLPWQAELRLQGLRELMPVVGRVSGREFFTQRNGLKVKVALIDLPHDVHVLRHHFLSAYDHSDFRPWRPHISLHNGAMMSFGEVVHFDSIHYHE